MTETGIKPAAPKRPIRWWPGVAIFLLAAAAWTWVRLQSEWPFQKRNLETAKVVLIALLALLLWWALFSRARWKARLAVLAGFFLLVGSVPALFRIRGVSGDLIPILEFRWAKHDLVSASATHSRAAIPPVVETGKSFPQFYGPNRDGVLPGLKLETNWTTHPPQLLWKQKIGGAWSGFAIVGEIAVTQEQRGEDECVVAYELKTGRQLWLHADRTRYHTVIAGDGPRATPTIRSHRVFTAGATGRLNCLDLASGQVIWTRDVVVENKGKVPGWGCAGSPLIVDEMVLVHGGEDSGHTLLAFQLADGKPVWSTGTANPSYASPILATLGGVRQVIGFNSHQHAGYDTATGAMLWESPWGIGYPGCSTPVVIGPNRILFSAGYGVGAELLELTPVGADKMAVKQIWKSTRMKAKFAHIYARDDFLYGLDDGMFACVDLKDGSLKWKEGRYGHGQGLLVGEHYLLMAEAGELVLLRPTPDAPNELARFRVFNAKTWNPPALAGEYLLVRNDLEAACLRLKLAP
ncbi:MAG: hypothetical protein EXS35_12845 [Pedosphaera sp.]|nr:hypothetical protein [Pedosphaera sp.]